MKTTFDVNLISNTFLLVISFFILCLSFSAEYLFGEIPCVFCLYQRHLYVAIFAVSLFKVLSTRFTHKTYDFILVIQTFLSGLLFVIGFYHSLMQRGFVGPTEACIVQMQEHIANYGIAEYTETLCETGPKVLGLYSAELSTLNALMFLVILFLSFRMKKLLSF